MAFILQTAKDNIFNATDLCTKATSDLKKKHAMLKGLLQAAKDKTKIVSDGLNQLKYSK